MSAPRIKVDSRQLDRLLTGNPVTVTHRGLKLPTRGSPIGVTLSEPLELRAIVLASTLRPRSARVWIIRITLDRAAPPMLLAAESGTGAGFVQLGEGESQDSARAHGFTEKPAEAIDDAGEAIPHGEVVNTAESQAAAQRYASDKADELGKRRDRSLAARTRAAFMQARARGVDTAEAIEAIETTLAELERTARRAA